MPEPLPPHQAWLASTRAVGNVLAIGLFVLAGMQLVLLPLMLGRGMSAFWVLIRAPFLGAFLGGGLMAIGWLVILGKQPHRAQRVLAIIGMLTSVALALSGLSAFATGELFEALGSRPSAWLRVAVTAIALVGASMWRGGQRPPIATFGWIGCALMVFLCAFELDLGAGLLTSGVIPIATWTFAGIAALGMRVVRTDLPPGVPSAVLVQR